MIKDRWFLQKQPELSNHCIQYIFMGSTCNLYSGTFQQTPLSVVFWLVFWVSFGVMLWTCLPCLVMLWGCALLELLQTSWCIGGLLRDRHFFVDDMVEGSKANGCLWNASIEYSGYVGFWSTAKSSLILLSRLKIQTMKGKRQQRRSPDCSLLRRWFGAPSRSEGDQTWWCPFFKLWFYILQDGMSMSVTCQIL